MAEAQGGNYYNSLSFFKKLPPDHSIEYKGKRYRVCKLVEMLTAQQLANPLSATDAKKKALTYDENSLEYWRSV